MPHVRQRHRTRQARVRTCGLAQGSRARSLTSHRLPLTATLAAVDPTGLSHALHLGQPQGGSLAHLSGPRVLQIEARREACACAV